MSGPPQSAGRSRRKTRRYRELQLTEEFPDPNRACLKCRVPLPARSELRWLELVIGRSALPSVCVCLLAPLQARRVRRSSPSPPATAPRAAVVRVAASPRAGTKRSSSSLASRSARARPRDHCDLRHCSVLSTPDMQPGLNLMASQLPLPGAMTHEEKRLLEPGSRIAQQASEDTAALVEQMPETVLAQATRNA